MTMISPVSDLDRYVFDNHGYLVLPGVLSADEVAEINAALDRCVQWPPASGLPKEEISGWLGADSALRALIDHERVLPYLTEWLSPAARLDHYYAIFADAGTPPHTLHLGATPHVPGCTYGVHNGRIHSGLLVVSWALTDLPDGEGGFVCVPGSHKANFPCPREVAAVDGAPPNTCVQVPMQAGDAILFTEAMTHGARAWNAPFTRRSLLFKYMPGHMAWSPGAPLTPGLLEVLTPRQRKMLEPPYIMGYEGLRGPLAEL